MDEFVPAQGTHRYATVWCRNSADAVRPFVHERSDGFDPEVKTLPAGEVGSRGGLAGEVVSH